MTKTNIKETGDQELLPMIDPAPIPPAPPLVFPHLLRQAVPAEVTPVDPFAYTDIRDIVRVPAGFTCSVKFAHRDDYLPFMACPDDVEVHGRAIHADCTARQADGVPDYFPTDAELLEATQERMARELRRANSAVTKYQDRVDVDRASDADIALLRAWKIYRVDLNELPESEKFPHGLTWPIAPDSITA
jgi:hypothetical protein